LYRLGSISIEVVVSKYKYKRRSTIAPGMLSKHYAPKLKLFYQAITQDLILFDKKELEFNLSNFLKMKNIVAHGFVPTGNLTEAASQLYNALHKLDQLHLM
jgi:L-threonylcarbamoyladenylate synthase